jgi:DNA-binding response OmpR family regulator
VSILIVDDEPGDRTSASEALELAGFAVLAVESYDAALRTFEEHAGEIDLAVLDISLPGRNGVDLFRELLKRNRDLKVVFISGHVGAEVIRFYGLKASNRHFLRKPFPPKELVARVDEILRSEEAFRLDESDANRGTQPSSNR